MKVTKDSLGELNELLHFEITVEDYKPRYDKQIKDLRKKVQLPGFRVGNTPLGIIEKRFGDSVLAEELNKIVNEKMGDYLKENGYNLLGDAIPAIEERLELNYKESKPYKFSYEIGIQPTIDLSQNLNKNKTFTVYRIPAKDEEIMQEVERLKRKYGRREDVETAENGDVIYIHLHELNTSGTEKEGGIHAHSYFNFEMLTDAGLSEFTGVKKGEKKNIDDIFSVFKGDKSMVVKNVLMQEKADEMQIEAIEPKFEFIVERISRLYPAEIDDKFFNEVMKEYGEVESIEQLQEKIKQVIEEYNNRMTDVGVENEIYKHLSDTLEIPLPESFLRKWYKKTQEKEGGSEEFDKQFTQFLNQLKQSLIFQKIQREHGLEVKKEEVVNEAFENVRMSYGHLGDELVNYVAKNNLQDKNFVENMHDRVMQKKFFDSLKSYVNLEEQTTTLEEYQKLTKKEEEYAE
ncbi:MAG: trigger factor [Chitinophagales bacterium]